MELTAKKMQKALDEINQVFGNEMIDFEGDESGLKLELKTALDLIEEGDKFSDETEAILAALKEPAPKKEEKKKILKKKEPAPKKEKKMLKPKGPVVIEHKDEEEEEDEVDVLIELDEEEIEAIEEETPPLEEEEPIKELTVEEIITGSKKITELEGIVEASPVFKKLKKMIGKFTNINDLKQAMLDVLEESRPKIKTTFMKEPKKAKPIKVVVDAPEEKEDETIASQNELIVINYKEEFAKLGNAIAFLSTVYDLAKGILKELESSVVAQNVKTRKGMGTLKTKPGVVNSIAKILEDAGPEGITREDILEKLCVMFPDREESSMANTLGAQVPGVMSKTRFEVGKHDDGRYYKV